jgi:MYXO-CTERM domain-containing protein
MSRRLPELLAAALVSAVAGVARADLPPPDGMTRVDYTFEIDRAVEGRAIVAFPQYGTGDRSNVTVVEPGKSIRPFKGWTPGLYLVAQADVASIPRGDQEAAKTWLEAHARVCLKVVPRVFDIAKDTNVDEVRDVIHLEAKGDRCEAALVRSVYKSIDGKTVEGGVDASGDRTAPAPIGPGLPSVREAGFVAFSGPPSPSPSPTSAPAAASASSTSPATGPSATAVAPRAPSSGCAGCTVTSHASRGGAAVVWGAALVLALLRRRRSR